MQGIDMFGHARCKDGSVDPKPSPRLKAEFKYEWEVPLSRSSSKSSFNHHLVGLDFIFCWSFRFPGQPDCCDDPQATAQYLQNLSKPHPDRVIDREGCTGRVCTSFVDHQRANIQIPAALRGYAFLIDDIRDGNGQPLKPDAKRMGLPRCIRVVSLKGLLKATFDQPPQSTIAFAPRQSGSSSSAAASASSRSAPASAPAKPPTSAAYMPALKLHQTPAGVSRPHKQLWQIPLPRRPLLQQHLLSRSGLAHQKRLLWGSKYTMASQRCSKIAAVI